MVDGQSPSKSGTHLSCMTNLKRPFCVRRAQLFWLIAIVALAVGLCSPSSVAQDRRRHQADLSDMTVQRDIVYRRINGHSLQLDIYTPKTITHPLPVVIWIHGA